jgi:hypothetical protein
MCRLGCASQLSLQGRAGKLLLLLLLQGELAAKTGAAAAGQVPPEAAAAAAAQAQLSGSHRHIAELLLEQVRTSTCC